MTMDSDSFLMGAGGRSATFKNVNDQVDGVVMSYEMRQQTDPKTREVKTWNDGAPMMQLVVTLLTEEHTDDDDDGLRRLYIKGQMQMAVADAVRKAGARGIREGGRLFVRYTGDGQAARPGLSAPKHYFAKYQAPVQAVSEYDGDEPADLPF